MDEADGRPDHVAFQFGHLNAYLGAPKLPLSLFEREHTKPALPPWIPAKPLIPQFQYPVSFHLAAPVTQLAPGTAIFIDSAVTRSVREENDHENVPGK